MLEEGIKICVVSHVSYTDLEIEIIIVEFSNSKTRFDVEVQGTIC